ncbi:probable small intestine urate exporter [Patella vulgata]|uniref:probable small intestine urate exporter n=1 Tax=Patella vulgata TaxID=6465 RepID=UPI0024A8B8DA|nr:probable small intestine urate exporter [Patella vulgata]
MAPNSKPGLPKLVINGKNEIPVGEDAEDSAVPSEQVNAVDKSKTEDPPPTPQPKLPTFKEKLFSWRWRISMILSLGNFATMNMRGAMAMAIVCMAGAGGEKNTSSLPTSSNMTPYWNETRPQGNLNEYEFDWDRSIRGTILSATMYCGFFAPFLGGLLSQKFGARLVVGIAMMAAGISCLLIPEMTRLHVYALVTLRFFLGVFTVSNIAAFQDIWSQWAPQLERVTLVSFSISGVNFANMFSSLVSGFLCTIPYDNGWPFVFYLFGGTTVLWSILWMVFVYNTPEEHPFISEAEKQYIKENRTGMGNKKKVSPPWCKLLTSRAVWAFVFVQTCNMWCAVTLFLYLPVYLNSILGFPIDVTGLLLSIPFMCRFFGSLFWGYISDLLLRKTKLGVTKIRKIIQTIGFTTSATTAGLLTFIPEDYRTVAIAVIAILMFFQSASMASSAIIPLDIAPRYAGIITGGFVVMGSVLGILAPMVTSMLIYGGTREVEWRIVFFILAGFYTTGMLTFNIMGSAELQSWADEKSNQEIGDEDVEDKDVNGDGLDNMAFEIDIPSSDGMRKDKGESNGSVRRIRTISTTTGCSSGPRTAEVSVAIVQPSVFGTPQMVMKFKQPIQTPKSPQSAVDKSPFFTQPMVHANASPNCEKRANGLDITSSVIPLDTDKRPMDYNQSQINTDHVPDETYKTHL